MPKLLLADDNAFSRGLLVRRLQLHGFEMLAASDGREALQIARSQRPDLILMDLEMPLMDGRAAIRALRNDPRTFQIPIIVLTAHASTEEVSAAVEAGCRAYETKPIGIRRLLERIEEVLGKTPGPESMASENL